MSTPEKYFINLLKSHHCQLPPSDDFEYMKNVKKVTKYFLISEKNLKSYLKAKSLSAIYYEKRRQIRTSKVTTIHPYSEFHRLWQFWMCFVFLMAVILFPFSSAFHGPLYAKYLIFYKKDFTIFYSIVLLVFLIQLFCIVDIAVNFMTGYVNKETDEMVIQPSRIARRYICTYFFVDLVSSIPYDSILIIILGITAYSRLTIVQYGVCTIFPLLKLIRLRTLYVYFYNIFGYFSSSYSVYKMVAAVFLYILMIHWTSCLNILVPRMVYYDEIYGCTSSPCNTSWLEYENVTKKNLFGQYLAAVERSLNCFTGIGFRVFNLRNIEDKLLAILNGLIGKMYWMFLLVIFLQMTSTIRSGKMRYLEMIDQVKQFIDQKRLPSTLHKKILQYYVYMFQNEFIGERSILKLLSQNLQQEITLEIHQSLIEKIYMFSGLSDTVVYEIVSCLTPELYLTNDTVYKSGDVGHYMYFISFGTVVVYAESGREIGHLEDGEYFGELSLILLVRRCSTVVALEPTKLYKLSIGDFLTVIKPQAAIFAKMEKVAIDRYNKCHDIRTKKRENAEKKYEERNKDDEDEEDEDEDDFDEDEKDDDLSL
ncbi:hypothetical protein RUM44_013357 [Polyplax serrata]|uniref:Cyclic nucleotide-binding domain-containing protein n=1 Tax=Polyplax serrata TaxID=468196 RepID=A0ABR1BHP1_POLSC